MAEKKSGQIIVNTSSQDMKNQEDVVGDESKYQYEGVKDEAFDIFQKGGLSDDVSPGESRKIARKFDLHLLPILCTLYGLFYIDKAALGWAVLFTFKEDLGLVGEDYSWVSSIFYFGYIAGQYPSSYCLQRFATGKVIAFTCLAWSIIMLGHMGCTNYAGILVCRFLLGFFEAPISGGFVLYCSLFYTRKEQVVRTLIWGSMEGIFYIIFGFITYGMGHAHSETISEWQAVYLLLGLCTFVTGVVWTLFIPDSPVKARFLTEEEKLVAIKRVSKNMMGLKTYDWQWNQVIECLIDPKTWFMAVFLLIHSIPNGGLTNFGSLVLSDIIHGRLETIAVGVGKSFFSSGQMLIYSLFALKYNNLRTIGMSMPILLAIAGLSAVYATEDHGAKWGRVFAYWMINSYSATWPFCLAAYGSNYAGHTKRAFMSMIFLVAYSVGNIIGPFCFKSSDAPKYTHALTTILGCFCACFVVAVGFRFYLIWANKSRDKKYGVVKEEISEDERLEGILNGMKDQTDMENKQFRYVL